MGVFQQPVKDILEEASPECVVAPARGGTVTEPGGRLEAIWIKRAHGGPMDPVTRATAAAGRGLAGNADQGGKRQVTIIEREVFEALRGDLGPAVEPRMRRANLLVSGVRLPETRGRVLQVGSVRIRVLGETRPCVQMDEALPGLPAAPSPPWLGGVLGEVLDGGAIAVGDPVSWVEGPPAA